MIGTSRIGFGEDVALTIEAFEDRHVHAIELLIGRLARRLDVDEPLESGGRQLVEREGRIEVVLAGEHLPSVARLRRGADPIRPVRRRGFAQEEEHLVDPAEVPHLLDRDREDLLGRRENPNILRARRWEEGAEGRVEGEIGVKVLDGQSVF